MKSSLASSRVLELRNHNVAFYDVAKVVVSCVLRVAWRMTVTGAESVPRDGPLIVVCNHVSYFDPPALGCALPRPISYMAKSELFTIPILGAILPTLRAFPVDRRRGDVAAIRRAVSVLRTGAAIGIFPEGTRNRDGSAPPHSGAAFLAKLSGAPVLPAYVAGTDGARRFDQIKVAFGRPIQFVSGEEARRDELAKWTDEIMSGIRILGEGLRAN